VPSLALYLLLIQARAAHDHSRLGDYTPPTAPHFLWVTEFPLFTRADADKEHLAHGRWSSSHHPFTAPMAQDVPALWAATASGGANGASETIERIRGQHYDLVLDGMEIGGGSVRVHDPAMQEHIFRNILQVRPLPSNHFPSFPATLLSSPPIISMTPLARCYASSLVAFFRINPPRMILSGSPFLSILR
jgi:aspartyl-tRNA synthetase